MLIKCPECELQISDKALMCPHCGYPLSPQVKNITRKSNKRKRLPNGFGQISEIKGRNLRKPYRAMVTVGKTETGHPISKPLRPVAYFETYNEAYAALMEYNRNPYDVKDVVTIQELYERWYRQKEKGNVSNSSLQNYKWTWKQCASIHNKEFRSLTIAMMKESIEGLESVWLKKSLKNIFNSMYDYAIENGIVDRNLARAFTIHEKRPESNIHTIYTDEEMAKLWANADVGDTDLILIQCYTGMRPGEIGSIRMADFDHDNMWATGGSKTESGKNRPIIFHSRIQPLVERRYQQSLASGSEWLFSRNGEWIGYKGMYSICKSVCKNILGTAHKAHDGRVTFATMAKRANMDEYVLKKLMGHSIDDLTERVYTKRDNNWLREELEKIK